MLLLQPRGLARRTWINMTDVKKRIFILGRFVEPFEIADGHRRIENDLAAFLFRLVGNFRRLSLARKSRKKYRSKVKNQTQHHVLPAKSSTNRR